MTSRILIVGAGAVGGYFGARMAAAGHDVTFLVRPKRRSQLLADGLCLRSTIGDITLTPKTTSTQDITNPYDIVLLSVKAYSLASAMDDFSAAVGTGTHIIPLLNGMRHLDILTARFGQHAVMGGTCFIVSKLNKQGHIEQSGSMPRLSFGEISGRETAKAQQIEKILSSPGFETICSTHILQDMWNKWVLLASLGSICCLMRGTVGEISRQKYGTNFIHAVIDECVAIATATGYCPDGQTIDGIIKLLSKKDSSLTSSMFRDLCRGGPIEAQQIIGDLVIRARKHDLSTPLLDLTNINLGVYEQQHNQMPLT
ncbi:ketopantoate reductase family protein [Novacetimonas hansenii]|uniref:ketopantoate reductase family protein n=1 Tax=Novacetimonas hansenii TaxID=436 RepID=UPI000789B206|nr:ketopantoate reductase family protein [Novacetimonas hansenii]WEQ59761.1 ketopantoate reductase family protein [Novacetimonas hansenii]CUW47848.1 2-dehydropantoate 2-reductase [Novacetimonas hansenii]